jgi:hypothetical protein
MNSVPTRRPCSGRGRRATSLPTLCCASTTTWRLQGSSCPVRGAVWPNDEEQHWRLRTFPGWLPRSDRDRHQGSSGSVGCEASPTSASSSSTTRMSAEPTGAVLGRTRPRWMRPYGATSVAGAGSSLGDFAPWGSNLSGPGRRIPYEPGQANPRLASPGLRVSCCSICSVAKARRASMSADPPKPSRPFDVRGSVCDASPKTAHARASRRVIMATKGLAAAIHDAMPSSRPPWLESPASG